MIKRGKIPPKMCPELIENSRPVYSFDYFIGKRDTKFYLLNNPIEGTYVKCQLFGGFTNNEHIRVILLERWGVREENSVVNLRQLPIKENGFYTFRELKKQEASKMNYKTLATLANEANTTTAKVSFKSEQKEYTYKITRELAAKSIPGDLMVVANTSDTPYKIVVLNSIDASPEVDVDNGVDYTWIVDRLRTDDFDRAIEMEQRISLALQKEHRRVTAKQSMDKLGMSGFDVTKALKNE